VTANGLDEDLESREFREALLSSLNGQSEEMKRLVKLIDTRFLSHGRRLRELKADVRRDLEPIGPLLGEFRAIKRIGWAILGLIPGGAGILGLLATFGVF